MQDSVLLWEIYKIIQRIELEIHRREEIARVGFHVAKRIAVLAVLAGIGWTLSLSNREIATLIARGLRALTE